MVSCISCMELILYIFAIEKVWFILYQIILFFLCYHLWFNLSSNRSNTLNENCIFFFYKEKIYTWQFKFTLRKDSKFQHWCMVTQWVRSVKFHKIPIVNIVMSIVTCYVREVSEYSVMIYDTMNGNNVTTCCGPCNDA